VRRAKTTVETIYGEAAELAFDSDQRKNLFKFALKSEAAGRIAGMLNLAQSEPGIPVLPAALDADPWLFNCANGTIDLKTGTLREHRREDLLTCLSPVAYDPQAACPDFEKFLWQIFNGNQNIIDFIWLSLGYALTGETREQCFWIFWGNGANGKGTLVDCISEIFGSYRMNVSTETLLAKQNEGSQIRSDVARLDGPRLVTAAEIDKGRRLSESLIKGLSGKDTITARFLYGKDFDFRPQFKLFIQTNNKPIIRDQTNAMWRRLKLVEFPMDFREHPDRELPEKLRVEMSGILAGLVRSCLNWQQYGDLNEPDEVKEAVQEYRAEMDPLKEFLETKCLIGPDLTTPAAGLYSAYNSYADENNLQKRERLLKRSFGLALAEQGFRKAKGTSGVRLWRGIGLRAPEV
jgi:putative DNA primase/helicase